MSQVTPSNEQSTAKRPPRYSEARRPQSKVRAGKRALPTAHSQSIWARVFRDVMGALIAHIGGEQVVSETQRLAIRRVAALETEMIYFEDDFARARADDRVPNPQDVTLYASLANAQRRFCEALGWQRTPREVVPSLAQWAADIEAAKAASAPDGADDVDDANVAQTAPASHQTPNAGQTQENDDGQARRDATDDGQGWPC